MQCFLYGVSELVWHYQGLLKGGLQFRQAFFGTDFKINNFLL
jgi:hypothetical protein